MTHQNQNTQTKDAQNDKKKQREQRLTKQLRDNLRRRKEQSRKRS
ncbi:hypothetical protein [Bartonella melophagi]|nr:hypothetical protein [Bartonella melophagi]